MPSSIQTSHRRYLTFGLIIFCFLVIVGGLDVLYLRISDSPAHTVAQTSIKQPATPEGLMSLMNSIALHVSQRYPMLKMIGAADTTNTVGYPLSGYSFAVLIPYNALTTVSFTDPSGTNETAVYAQYQQVLPTITQLLDGAGFQSMVAQTTQATSLETIRFFARSGADCQITSYSQLDIYCDTTSDLTTIASLADPLVSAYDAANPSNVAQTISSPVIQNSQTAGYSIGSVEVFASNGETKVNFYRQDSGPWQVVNLGWYNDPHQDADIQPNCEDFESNAEVRAAFKGQHCYDSDLRSESVVQ
jgi:hypothetical protein